MVKDKLLSDEIINDNDDQNKYSFNNTNQNNDLFDDEQNVIHSIISVKRIRLPKSGENWEILEDGRVKFVLKGIRLTNREKSILYSLDGINLLMREYKSGNKSVVKIKKLLKEFWRKKNDNI